MLGLREVAVASYGCGGRSLVMVVLRLFSGWNRRTFVGIMGRRRNMWGNEGWMKARTACYLVECLTGGQGVGRARAEEERPKAPPSARHSLMGREISPHSLVSSKGERLRGIVPSIGGPGKRGHMSTRHKQTFPSHEGKLGGWP